MKYAVRRLGRSVIRHFGFELSRYLPLARALNVHRIDTVFDIGANQGQFGSELRHDGYTGKIISFEPMSAAHQVLARKSRGDRMWHVHEACAIGAADASIEINVSRNSGSSSILPITAEHTDAAPDSVYVRKERVKQVPLDRIFPDYANSSNRVFLKIDTQGYEKEVMAGAPDALAAVVGLQLEISFSELYEKQPNYRYFLDWADAHGFALWSIQDGFSNMAMSKTLQADICFFRA
jgi:FkbM family methyltransferase